MGDYDPGGSGDKFYHYQQLRNRYANLKGEGNFEVLHRKNNDAIEFEFNGIKTNGISDANIGEKFSKSFVDSISINGIIYKNLLKLPVKPYHYFYLNTTYGIFQITDTLTWDNWTIY
jgi:hypothetical protein